MKVSQVCVSSRLEPHHCQALSAIAPDLVLVFGAHRRLLQPEDLALARELAAWTAAEVLPARIADVLFVDELGKGRLAGKQGNRVKVRLYGTVRSEGLYYGSQYFEGGDPGGPFKTSDSWNSNWRLGHDVAPELGITFREGE